MRIAFAAACSACAARRVRRAGNEPGQQRPGQYQRSRPRRRDRRQRRDMPWSLLAAAPTQGAGARDHARASRRHGNDRQDHQGDASRARRGAPGPRRRSAPPPTKIADLSQKASGWFPAGTGPNVGKTGAKPEIWQNPQDFAAKLRDSRRRPRRSMPPRGRRPRMRSRRASATSARRCKACHDKYRVGDAPLSGQRAHQQPVWDLPVRLFHWLLAGADRCSAGGRSKTTIPTGTSGRAARS